MTPDPSLNDVLRRHADTAIADAPSVFIAMARKLGVAPDSTIADLLGWHVLASAATGKPSAMNALRDALADVTTTPTRAPSLDDLIGDVLPDDEGDDDGGSFELRRR